MFIQSGKALLLLVFLLDLNACSSFARLYRSSNAERRIYPVTTTSSNDGAVDLIPLLDPLDLGPSRVEALHKAVVRPGYAVTAESAERSRLEMALFGFYDSRYPALLCGSVPQGLEGPAEDQRAACAGLRPPAAPVKLEEPPNEIELVTTTSEVVEKVLYRKGAKLGTTRVSSTTNTKTDRKPLPSPQTFLSAFQTARRNQVQDRLMQASNTQCSAFKDDIYLLKSDSGFGFSVATLGLGAAGALVGDLARTFAALGAATAGTGIAFDKSYFAERTIPIIVAGIEKRREERRLTIDEKRKSPIESYSMQAALGDVAVYHDACSIRSGLDEAKETLSDQLKQLTGGFNKTLDDFDAKAAAAAKAEAEKAKAGGAGAGTPSGEASQQAQPLTAETR